MAKTSFFGLYRQEKFEGPLASAVRSNEISIGVTVLLLAQSSERKI